MQRKRSLVDGDARLRFMHGTPIRLSNSFLDTKCREQPGKASLTTEILLLERHRPPPHASHLAKNCGNKGIDTSQGKNSKDIACVDDEWVQRDTKHLQGVGGLTG